MTVNVVVHRVQFIYVCDLLEEDIVVNPASLWLQLLEALKIITCMNAQSRHIRRLNCGKKVSSQSPPVCSCEIPPYARSPVPLAPSPIARHAGPLRDSARILPFQTHRFCESTERGPMGGFRDTGEGKQAVSSQNALCNGNGSDRPLLSRCVLLTLVLHIVD